MSYDLIFAPRDGVDAMTAAAFEGYFGTMPHYELTDTQAFYANEDTGVHFWFEHDPETVSFNLNFNRPSFFALEAATEVEAFVAAFDLLTDDSQTGELRGGFSRERFVSEWGRTNKWACSDLRQTEGLEPPLTYPGERLRRIWQWNFERAARQAEAGDQVFIPKISFADVDDAARTFVVWPDAIVEHIPEVDFVVLVREQLAPRRWFRKREAETLLAPWAAVVPVLPSQPHAIEPLPHYRVEPSPRVISFFREERQPLDKDHFTAVTPDAVFDAEYFA